MKLYTLHNMYRLSTPDELKEYLMSRYPLLAPSAWRSEAGSASTRWPLLAH